MYDGTCCGNILGVKEENEGWDESETGIFSKYDGTVAVIIGQYFVQSGRKNHANTGGNSKNFQGSGGFGCWAGKW